jgi:hypothetical protein
MHDIEPFYLWRDLYNSSEDEKSPFYKATYSEFTYSNKIYNYYVHPQWDSFGSANLYIKILFVDYADGFAIIELIGEWNDCIENDIMFLKRDIIDVMIQHKIKYFILLCEHVLNFHGSDDCYYEEWKEDISDEGGWICFINILEHVKDEMKRTLLQYHTNFGKKFNDLNWRKMTPTILFEYIDQKI